MAVPALLAVDPGGEGALPVGPQDDGVDVVVPPAPAPDVGELVEHGLVEGVEDVGPVEGDGGDVLGHVEQDRLVLHAPLP